MNIFFDKCSSYIPDFIYERPDFKITSQIIIPDNMSFHPEDIANIVDFVNDLQNIEVIIDIINRTRETLPLINDIYYQLFGEYNDNPELIFFYSFLTYVSVIMNEFLP